MEAVELTMTDNRVCVVQRQQKTLIKLHNWEPLHPVASVSLGRRAENPDRVSQYRGPANDGVSSSLDHKPPGYCLDWVQ